VHVLNEIVLDRGPSPYSVQLDLSIFDVALTHSVGDGLIVSTPTGSTAYNLSAGGSIVETTTKCMCLTPLAPHSLSFRPIILPDSSVLKIEKSQDNRTPAWVSLDGANRFQLLDGESIIVEGSEHPLRMVTLKTDNLTDLWAQRLVKFFGWNTRQQNKPLEKKQRDPNQVEHLFGGPRQDLSLRAKSFFNKNQTSELEKVKQHDAGKTDINFDLSDATKSMQLDRK
jgi:NAD+ kinase